MFNSIEFYADAGQKAGTARRQHDEARAKFTTEHFRKALALEAEQDRPAARKAFDDAYTGARGVTTQRFA